jgi:acyl-CoA thioesterase FadM
MVEVRTRLKEAGRRKVVFAYEVLRGETRLAEGESAHVVTGADGRARVMPDDLLHLLSRAL